MSFEFFGFTLNNEQLIIIGCFAVTFIIVLYIVKLVKSRSKEEEQTEQQTSLATLELIRLVSEMWHHQVGNPTSHKPTPTAEADPEPEIVQPPSTVQEDEEDHVPTKEEIETMLRVQKSLLKKNRVKARR